MASVKSLKGKGRAEYPGYALCSPLYQLRKQQFADRPAAKIVKPVRYADRVACECLDQWDLAIKAGAADIVFPTHEVNLAAAARRFNGHPVVQRIAAAA